MILFENVFKLYRGTDSPALNNVSFSIDSGEFVFLVGASGSGKSTCLSLILREEQADSGEVLVSGKDTARLTNREVQKYRRGIGSVFQDFRLLSDKTVSQNVAFSLQVIGASRGKIRQAVPQALALVGLENKGKRYPSELSGGEKQRVAIARAFVNNPKILLADEPTGNLDPATSNEIMQLLLRINALGTTVVMATHEASFVDQLQRRVLELRDGVLLRDEISGGYGDTSSLPVLGPAQPLGTSAKIARAELDRLNDEMQEADAASLAASAAAMPRATTPIERITVGSQHPVNDISEAAVWDDFADPGSSEALLEETEIELEELRLLDKLGLDSGDDEQKVGPTS